MSIKTELLNKYKIIIKSKELVNTLDPEYITCKTYNKRLVDDNTISIVMTTYNRPEQTLFSLKTIANSNYNNVHVVLVDDYKNILLYDMELAGFGIYIDYIRIKNKFWINPCINYNIGFRYIKGNKIIIQNAEVCHIGDVISYVSENLHDNEYFSFDVLNLNDRGKNLLLYTRKSTSYKDTYSMRYYKCYWPWYQHFSTANNNLHFLTAITKKTLDKIKGFDYDFCLGTCWDDNAFIYNIKINNIKVITINNETAKIMGIHQWHAQTPSGFNYKINNDILYTAKVEYYKKNGIYIDITEDDIPENIIKKINNVFAVKT